MRDEPLQSKFQETTSRDGYFKSFFNNFREVLKDDLAESFSKLKKDEDRIRFVSTYLPQCKEVKEEINNGKDGERAMGFKEKGNAEFVRGDTNKALDSYTNCILTVPFSAESSREIAIALANRSAALYHLEKFEEAIKDVEAALVMSYPRELHYKALERKAKCLLALKNHNEAIVTFRETLTALDESKLQTEKKIKMQNDIQIMLNVLTKPVTQKGRINTLVEGQKSPKKDKVVPTLTGKKNSAFPAISQKVAILEGEGVGRYASAKSNINPGETIAVEKAYCSVLLAEHLATHCIHCFKRTQSPYPCSGCSTAVFCGSQCKDAALASYHRYECSISNAMYRSGASVTVLMALRMITQHNLKYFLDIKSNLQKSDKERKVYRSDDYESVYNLVCHEQQRQPEDFLERTVMAVFLLRSLHKVGYFGQVNQQLGETSDDDAFIGSLLLRHLQLLQFNAHEIAELEMDSTESMDKAKSIFIGGGLFPTLALFNHACDPAVVRYFVGTTVIVKTVRPVDVGDGVAENYGPIFTIRTKEQRQKELKARYWFDCGCKPCMANWPLLSEMNRRIIRFRCNSGEATCSGVIEVASDTAEFMLQCKLCGKHTNLLKGLKALQDTDGMYRQASLDTDRGKYEAALAIYFEILRILHKHLAPPFYDYHVCQEAVRKCMLSMGNKYIKEI